MQSFSLTQKPLGSVTSGMASAQVLKMPDRTFMDRWVCMHAASRMGPIGRAGAVSVVGQYCIYIRLGQGRRLW